MVKARLHWISLTALALVAGLMLSCAASASLFGTNFGFPVLVHTSQTVSFSNDQAISTDNEAMNLNFPAFHGIASDPSSSTFPGMDMGNDLLNKNMTTNFGQIGSLLDFNKLGFH